MSTYLFDIDGTLADCEWRRFFIAGPYKNWDSFFAAAKDDKPFPHMQQLAADLNCGETNNVRFVYVTGRPERCRELTKLWLRKHDFPEGEVYMRLDHDHRPDDIVKAELLAMMRKYSVFPVMAFDDRDSVVKMWRENGVPCAQVAEGNF